MILATPGARLIKEADLAHNANADRLALLDEPTRTQLGGPAATRGAVGPSTLFAPQLPHSVEAPTN